MAALGRLDADCSQATHYHHSGAVLMPVGQTTLWFTRQDYLWWNRSQTSTEDVIREMELRKSTSNTAPTPDWTYI